MLQHPHIKSVLAKYHPAVRQALRALSIGSSDAAGSAQLDALAAFVPADLGLPAVTPAEAGNRGAQFVAASGALESMPEARYPEVAIVGRSNVGKSSLLNCLVGVARSAKGPAKVSRTPGKTQTINHHLVTGSGPLVLPPGVRAPAGVARSWYLVDCPGYGYAKVSKSRRHDWALLTQQYFKRRSTLAGVLLLVDSRLPPKPADVGAAAWLADRGLTYALVFTKADRGKAGEPPAAHNIAAFVQQLSAANGGAVPPPARFATSAVTGQGRAELLVYLAQLRKRWLLQQQQCAGELGLCGEAAAAARQ